MHTTIAPEIQQNPDWAFAVGRANDLLKAELGPSEPVVTTKWSTGHDSSNRPVIALEIADPMASVTANFRVQELTKNGDRLQVRLRRLWDNVLQNRSDKLMERIHQLATHLEGENAN